ncbi:MULTISPECIES: hypothetical protein [Ruminococcus]|uniref:hypothetical protein n=1 Tax=Ruminococcus TaxID=1263 RepID=UPI00056F3A23|nr:hypothetical protein [Ruminococcus bicirculans (ex Wegman et al. 2014)]
MSDKPLHYNFDCALEGCKECVYFNHMCCENCYYDGKCDFCAHDSDYNHMSFNSICSYCSCRAEK